MVNGPWKRLVFGHPARADGSVNRHAYAFCVLERFWRASQAPRDLRRRLHQVARPPAELLDGGRGRRSAPTC